MKPIFSGIVWPCIMRKMCIAIGIAGSFLSCEQQPVYAQAAPPTVNAQPAPVASTDAKLAYREAQHKLDVVEKQLASLQQQFDKIQQQAKSQYDAFTEQQKKAQADLTAAQETLLKSANADPAKYDLDGESLVIKAKPQPNTKAEAKPPNQAK